MQLTPLIPILAATPIEPIVGKFLDFIQVVSILFGLALTIGGVWRLSRGDIAEAIAPIAGGFLLCLAVVIIRIFASWIGVTI